MDTICYSGPISAVPTNEQRLNKERTCAKFQIDSLKTDGLVRVYTVANLIYPVQGIKMLRKNSTFNIRRNREIKFGILLTYIEGHVLILFF